MSLNSELDLVHTHTTTTPRTNQTCLSLVSIWALLLYCAMHISGRCVYSSFLYLLYYSYWSPFSFTKGGWWCLMSSSCLESQGWHLIPRCSLLSCFSAQSCCFFLSCPFSGNGPAPDFFFFFLKTFSNNYLSKVFYVQCVYWAARK